MSLALECPFSNGGWSSFTVAVPGTYTGVALTPMPPHATSPLVPGLLLDLHMADMAVHTTTMPKPVQTSPNPWTWVTADGLKGP